MGWREVLEDPTLLRVIRVRGYKEGTAKHLAKGVYDFCKFLGFDRPVDAVEKIKEMKLEEVVEVFKNYFIERKQTMAPKTIWNYMGDIKIWLYENGVDIDSISKKITREYRRYVSSRGIPRLLKREHIERDEIKRIILVSDVRTRALVSLLASSGLRIGVSALRLQLKHFRDNLEDDLPCYMLEIPEELTKAEYGHENPHFTFISREARDYLMAYLKKREQFGEKIGPETYLFVSQRNRRPDPDQPLTYRGALHLWERACEAAGIDRKPVFLPSRRGRLKNRNDHGQVIRYNIRIHSLRKYFKTACSLMGVDRMATEAMMGHSLSQFGIESVYDYCVTRLDWLRREYMKALPALTFAAELPPQVPTVNHRARKRIEELESELKKRDELLKEMREFLEKHEEELKEVKKRFDAIAKIVEEVLDKLPDEEKAKIERIARKYLG